jgi:peptide chain release factor 1
MELVEQLRARYAELSNALAGSSIDQAQRHLLQKEFSKVSSLLTKHEEIARLQQAVSSAQQEHDESTDAEMRELFAQELEELNVQLTAAQTELDELLFPADPLDNRPCFIEIRAGAGGAEAALFVGDLLRAYMAYCLKMRWPATIVDFSQTDLKGYRDVTLHVDKKGAYGTFRFESGTHRVQRVPATETQGRIHTSTVTVAVMPEHDQETEIQINPADLRIDTYRAGGAGGQHVNMTDSAVRITHLPTGIVTQCQDERSQHKNKAKAMKMLASRIMAVQLEKQQAEEAAKRKELVGTGMRAEKVRTYNYPQNRVTDHQIDLTLSKLDIVMGGDFQDLFDALRARNLADRKARGMQLS